MSYHERSSRLQLTNREIEIVRQLAEGKTSIEVGASLFITAQTVKFHLTSIYRKLGVMSRWAAVVKAFRLGLIPVCPVCGGVEREHTVTVDGEVYVKAGVVP